jgi:ABC-2 type transport system permease protein
MLNLIKAEIFKLRKRSMTYILLLILVGLIVLILSIMQATALSNNVTTVSTDGNAVTLVPAVAANVHFLYDAITSTISILGGLFGLILAVVLVANSTGSEYSWNTMRPYLLCSESRLKMLTAKLITAAIFIVAGMIIALLTAVLLGVLFTAIKGFSWDLGSSAASFTGHQLLNFVRSFYVIMPYALLAFLFTVLGRSTAAGIGFGIGTYILESIVTGLLLMAHNWLAKIPNYLLSINVAKISSLSESSAGVTIHMGTNTTTPSTLHAFLVVAAWGIFCVAASFFLFRKRDVTG